MNFVKKCFVHNKSLIRPHKQFSGYDFLNVAIPDMPIPFFFSLCFPQQCNWEFQLQFGETAHVLALLMGPYSGPQISLQISS